VLTARLRAGSGRSDDALELAGSAHYIRYRATGKPLLGQGYRRTIKLTPICKDTVGVVYRGKPRKIDPHEFARM